MAANYYALAYQINVIVQSQFHKLNSEMSGIINNHFALDLLLVKEVVVNIKGCSYTVLSNLKECLEQKIENGNLTLHPIHDRLYIAFHTTPSNLTAYTSAEPIILGILNDKLGKEKNYSPFVFLDAGTSTNSHSLELLARFFNIDQSLYLREQPNFKRKRLGGKNEIAEDSNDIEDINFAMTPVIIEYYPLAYAIISVLKEFDQQILSMLPTGLDFAVHYSFLKGVILAIKAKIENRDPKLIEKTVNSNIKRMLKVESKKQNLRVIDKEYILFYHDKYPGKFVGCRDLIIAHLLPYKEQISSLYGYVQSSDLNFSNIEIEIKPEFQPAELTSSVYMEPALNSYKEMFSCFQDGGGEIEVGIDQELDFSKESPKAFNLAARFFSPDPQRYIQPNNSAMQEETLAAIYSPPGFQFASTGEI